MKKYLKKLGIVVFCAVIFSCNKDQKLVSEIEGEYKLESIINYKNGEGTAVSFTRGRIFFQNCNMKDVGGNCNGWYELEGKTKVTFEYHVEKRKEAKIINITNLSSLSEPQIIGYFEFKSEGNYLILDGLEQSGSANGVVSTWYSDIRLSK